MEGKREAGQCPRTLSYGESQEGDQQAGAVSSPSANGSRGDGLSQCPKLNDTPVGVTNTPDRAVWWGTPPW